VDKDLVAVKIRNSCREVSVLADVIGSLGSVKEGAIEVNGHKLCGVVSLRSLGSGKVKGVVGIKHVSHEVAASLLQLLVEIVNNLLNRSVDLRELVSNHGSDDSMERSNHSIPHRAGGCDGHIAEVNECSLNKLPVDPIRKNDGLKVCLDNQALNVKLGRMQRNNPDDSHLAIEGGVHVDFAEVESDLSGARHEVDPSFVDIEGVYVDFMDLNIIGEAALSNLKIESLVVDKV
jgi:hypothetical protein